MKDLHPQFELLIQYADGHADAKMQKQAVELINADAVAADFYQSLLSTRLPYEEIYADQAATLNPAVQQSIAEQIKNTLPQNSRTGVNENSVLVENSDKQRGRFGPMAMAASLFCGVIGGAVLSGSTTGLLSNTHKPAAMVDTETPEWVRLVADYHRLYVRETITVGARQKAEAVSQQVSETLQVNLTVPSLQHQGIEFRRAQWLAIDDQPLLQLAYLPDSGKPLAVCVLKKDTSQDTAAEYGETGGMQYVHWQSGEHAIVIVGAVDHAGLQEIYSVVEQELL